MERDGRIRVVKRIQRERPAELPADGADVELSAQQKARGLAATVQEWVSESRQTRLAWYQEITRQLGWRQGEGDSPQSRPVKDLHEEAK